MSGTLQPETPERFREVVVAVTVQTVIDVEEETTTQQIGEIVRAAFPVRTVEWVESIDYCEPPPTTDADADAIQIDEVERPFTLTSPETVITKQRRLITLTDVEVSIITDVMKTTGQDEEAALRTGLRLYHAMLLLGTDSRRVHSMFELIRQQCEPETTEAAS